MGGVIEECVRAEREDTHPILCLQCHEFIITYSWVANTPASRYRAAYRISSPLGLANQRSQSLQEAD